MGSNVRAVCANLPARRFTDFYFSSSDFNLAVGILSAWVFLARILLQYLAVWGGWTEMFLNCCVFPFWITSIIGQRSADFTDPDHISHSPWYLSVGCSSASPNSQKACSVAQASFYMTIVITYIDLVFVFEKNADQV